MPRCARCLPVIGLALLGMACTPLHAQSAAMGGTVALDSQLVDRGLAITPATPVLQGALQWSSPRGWSLGVAASTELRSPGRLAEALAQVSRAWKVSDNTQVQASLLYYDSPGRHGARPYRRTEADLSWTYRDVLALNVSAIHPLGLRESRTNLAAEANLHWPLTRHLSLVAGAGLARFQRETYRYGGYDRYGEVRSGEYRYGQVGLAWAAGRWRVELDRIGTDGAPRARRGTGDLSPWLGTIAWSF